MKSNFTKHLFAVCATFSLTLALAHPATAQTKVSRKLSDEAAQSQKAARVFRQIMGAPDQGIPKSVLDGAECVAVFPSVIKAGFIVGGRGGRGVASCRTPLGGRQFRSTDRRAIH